MKFKLVCKLLSIERDVLNECVSRCIESFTANFTGLFIRRLLLSFERLTFHEVSSLFCDFKHFVEDDQGQEALELIISGRIADLKNEKVKLDEAEEGQFFNRKEAEYYIAKQVNLCYCDFSAVSIC